jgi:hypothetical protein
MNTDELCYKCNKPVEVYSKHLRCSGCDSLIKDCFCKILVLPEKPQKPKSRLNLIFEKETIKMDFSKFYETVKHLFDWDENTKIMIFALGALAALSIGGIQCARYNKQADYYNTQIKQAKIQLQQECIKTNRSTAECQQLAN